MIRLYTWPTPNGRKISIALEELGLDYDVVPIDINNGEQFDPEFLAISPNNQIPAIVDGDISLMDSGAILLYLAAKTGKLAPPTGTTEYFEVLQWLMWQIGNFGPMLGQAHHFLKFNRGKSEYAEGRYGNEAKRLYGVLDRRLDGREYVAGDLSIADIAIWGWASRRSTSKTTTMYGAGTWRLPTGRRFNVAMPCRRTSARYRGPRKTDRIGCKQ